MTTPRFPLEESTAQRLERRCRTCHSAFGKRMTPLGESATRTLKAAHVRNRETARDLHEWRSVKQRACNCCYRAAEEVRRAEFSARRGQNARERSVGGGGDPSRFRRVFHDRARSRYRSGQSLSGRTAGPAH